MAKKTGMSARGARSLLLHHFQMSGPLDEGDLAWIAAQTGYSRRQICRLHAQYLLAPDDPTILNLKKTGAPKGYRLPDDIAKFITKRAKDNRARVTPKSARQLALDIEQHLRTNGSAVPSLRTIQRMIAGALPDATTASSRGAQTNANTPPSTLHAQTTAAKPTWALHGPENWSDWLCLLYAYAQVKKRQAAAIQMSQLKPEGADNRGGQEDR